MIKSDLPIIIARDVYVDDITSELPILRIEHPGGTTAYRLAPCACRVLGLALTAAADIAERDVYGRSEVRVEHRTEHRAVGARYIKQTGGAR